MENKEIIEGNKLVAEFDGWVIDNSFPDKDRTYIKNGGIELDTTFKYHTSWDWLMPVVENIQSLAIDEVGEINVMIASHECLIGEDYYHPIINIERNGSYISMIYIAVVEFIKWYNENKNN